MSGLTCATAPGMEFASYDDLKQHYKTDWHRYNLKRKVRPRLACATVPWSPSADDPRVGGARCRWRLCPW